MHRLQRVGGVRGGRLRALLLVAALASTACGSYLSDKQLLSANDAEFRLTGGPNGTGPERAGQPVSASPGP